MGRRRRPVVLPAIATAFAVPLADGRYGACRVLRHTTADEEQLFGKTSCLVACSAWVGETVPQVEHPSLRTILQLTHHHWNGELGLLWVSRRQPDDFIEIGRIVPTEDEQSLCSMSGSWRAFRVQPYKQWLWEVRP